MNTDIRLSRLEERLTWMQQHAVEQDRIISAQSFEIDALKAQIMLIRKQFSSGPEGHAEMPDERPPHY